MFSNIKTYCNTRYKAKFTYYIEYNNTTNKPKYILRYIRYRYRYKGD